MNYKELARAYHTAVSDYDEVAVTRMVREDYIQHNPKVPTGRAALLAMLPNLKGHHSKIENIRMLRDGHYIVMHHLWNNAIPFGADQMAAFHIIRLDESHLIAEHWSVMTPMRPLNLSGCSLIDGETCITDHDKTEINRARILELTEKLIALKTETTPGEMNDYFAHDFSEHRSELLRIKYAKHHKTFAEGNFVLSVCEGKQGDVAMALYDLYRLDQETVYEHWNIYQEIPSQNLANNNTMFGFNS